MSNYSLSVKEMVNQFSGVFYQVIEINIKNIDGKFLHSSRNLFVRVSDSNASLDSFFVLLSGNQKELRGFFITDAFNIFTANVTISFGDGFSLEDSFENVDF